ncbi:MAG: phenylalanyl-tRNA synthetase alpha chain [Anaerolineaceae bacterium]|nr:MAG: phenylalanyl-tRNA synthetase alpha chain [Anaerolineaceae bacterium]
MLDKLKEIEKTALTALEAVRDEAALEGWRVAFLGRSSPLMQVFSGLGALSKEERPVVGQQANEVKKAIEAAFGSRSGEMRQAALERSLGGERLDVTLPGRRVPPGRLHPDTQILRELYRVFGEMGFQVYRSREVESDEYNFQLLNFPVGHPARDMQDTYFVEAEGRGDNPVLLRTHTSPGQIHAMREFAALDPHNPPPVRIVLPGMVYRYEQVDARHETQFDQLEGLAVGPGITFSDLKGTLADMARRLFGPQTRTRFRASFFPFTEPSAEYDIECFLCGGKGCAVCGGGWLEIGGCGMVHPVVLKNGGYDPERYTGFAFGLGPQRIAMLRYGISDIRYFWENDLRFLEQF